MKNIKILGFILLMIGFSQSNAQQTLFNELTADTVSGFNENIKFADFDADGFLDIISTTKTGNSYELNILRNDSLKFSIFKNVIPQSDSLNYALSDMNNDGLVDIVACRSWNDSLSAVTVFLNKKKFTFDKSYDYPVFLPGAVAIADFNNDGLKDIIANATVSLDSGFTDTSHAVLFKNTGRSFTPQVTTIPYLDKGKIAVLDYNNNARIDIFVTGKSLTDSLVSKIYLNNNLNFEETTTSIKPLYPAGIAIGNYNEDTLMDIFMAGVNPNGDLLNETDIHSELPSKILPGFPALNPLSLEMMDFDHDGLSDVFISGNDLNGKWNSGVFLKDQQKYIELFSQPTSALLSLSTGVADLNNDGNPDIFASTVSDAVRNSIFINTSKKNSWPAHADGLYSISIDTLTFLSWEPTIDDATAKQILSYDISIGNTPNASEINSANESVNSVKRLLRKNGVFGNNTYAYFSNLPAGLHYWNVTTIDNAFASHRDSLCSIDCGYTCSGKFPCDISKLDTTYHKKTILKLVSSSGEKAIWYSLRDGIIGKTKNIQYEVKGNDVLYCLQLSFETCSQSYVFNIKFDSLHTNPSVPPMADNIVFVPELFSPNQDGVNEVFKVYGKDISELALVVVDRNGSRLFESSDLNAITNIGWDGSVNGKPQPVGLYYWHIAGKNSNGASLTMNGNTKGVLRLVR